MNIFDPIRECIYCKAPVESFEPGPKGGASQNMTCRGCGARYNLAIPPEHLRDIFGSTPLFLEVLSPPPRPTTPEFCIDLNSPTANTRTEAERRVIDAARYIMQPVLWERASAAQPEEWIFRGDYRLGEALAALDALADTGEADGWREIATDPPPEDTEVLVGLWDDTGSYIMNDYYSSGAEQWCDWHGTVHKDAPTHWQPMLPTPLPSRPTTGEG